MSRFPCSWELSPRGGKKAVISSYAPVPREDLVNKGNESGVSTTEALVLKKTRENWRGHRMAKELEYVDMDLAGSPVCPGSRGWGQSRGDTWTGPDPAHRTRILWVLDIFQLDRVRQKEGTAVVWEKGPTEASSGG